MEAKTESQSSVQSPPAKKAAEGAAANGGALGSPTRFFGKLKPLLEKVLDVYAAVLPYYALAKGRAQQAWAVVKPYYEKYYFPELGTLLFGFVLLFFGGHFAMTIACWTAVQISGWPLMVDSYKTLKSNWAKAMRLVEADPQLRAMLDEDGDGEVTSEELAHAGSKFLKADNSGKMAMLQQARALFVNIDPNQVMSAFVGIWSALLCVIATLRSKFAKDVALGVSLGELLNKSARSHVVPILAQQVDKEMKNWVEFVVVTVCKLIGISIALLLVRVVSAFHSAMKGGAIVATQAFAFLASKGLLPGNAASAEQRESNALFVAVQYLFALYGFWWQASSGFVLQSFLLRLLLLPFSMVESILTVIAAY